MKTRKILAMLLALVMMLSMVACGGQAPAEEDAEVPATQGGIAAVETSPNIEVSKYAVTEPVAIEYWHSSAEGTPEYDYYVALCEKFNKSQDMVTVTPVYAGAYNDIMTSLGAAIQAQEGVPGVCQINVENLFNAMDIGLMEPLQDYCAANDVDTGDFIDAFIDVCTADNNLYALPHGISVAVFLYNKTLLSEVGLDTFPTTMEEFKTWAKEVYEKTGKKAYVCSCNQANILYNFAVNWGGTLVNEDGTTGFTNETVQGYVADLKELHDAGYIEWSNEKTGALNTLFKNGDVMALNISCTTYATLMNNPNNYEIGIGWNYECAEGISSVAGSYCFIPAELDQNTKNASFQFLQYMTNAENNYEWAGISSYMVSHKSVIADEEKMASIYEKLPEMVKVYSNTEKFVKKQPTVVYSDIMKVFMTGVAQIIIEGADPAATWAQIEADMNTRLGEA